MTVRILRPVDVATITWARRATHSRDICLHRAGHCGFFEPRAPFVHTTPACHHLLKTTPAATTSFLPFSSMPHSTDFCLVATTTYRFMPFIVLAFVR